MKPVLMIQPALSIGLITTPAATAFPASDLPETIFSSIFESGMPNWQSLVRVLMFWLQGMWERKFLALRLL